MDHFQDPSLINILIHVLIVTSQPTGDYALEAFSGHSKTSFNSGDDSDNIKMNALRLEKAKKFVQNRTCDRLNIGILDMKGSCPKKPTKDLKQKTKTLRCVDTLSQMRNICLFVCLKIEGKSWLRRKKLLTAMPHICHHG